jgi:nitrogen regulatory protein P-II 1
MKEIKAIIQPRFLDRVRDAFRDMPGFPGMSVSRIEGCSGHEGQEAGRGMRHELTDFTAKVRLEIIAPDDTVDEIVRIIHTHAHTGRQGDGVLWVADVSRFVRLREEPPG